MDNEKIRLRNRLLKIIRLYTKQPSLKQPLINLLRINPALLKEFVNELADINPKKYAPIKDSLNDYSSSWLFFILSKDLESLDILDQAAQDSSPEVLEDNKKFKEIENAPNKDKVELIDKLFSSTGKAEVKPSGQVKTTVMQSDELESAVKDLQSQGQIVVQRGIDKGTSGSLNIVKNIGKGLSIGGTAGAAADSLSSTGVRVAQGAGSGLKLFAGLTGSFLGRLFLFSTLGVIVTVVAIFIFMMISQSSAPLIDQTLGTTPTAPGGGIVVTGDISQCKFIRSDQDPRDINYQSPLLFKYFQEASGLTGVPVEVLAAFMRVESPGLTNDTDQDVLNYKCARSQTGALGVMQIQPIGTSGHAADAVANGAKLLGIDYNSLTEKDYCDVRKNIIMGAGFILKKMSVYGYGNGTKWSPNWTADKKAIEALVNGYYGCLIYGGDPLKCEGPYNYADDVWESLQSCKPTTAGSQAPGPIGFSLTCPVEGKINCGTAAKMVNNCGHGALPKYETECNPYYYVCDTTSGRIAEGPHAGWYKRYAPGLYYAVDIATPGNAPVKLPYINGNESVEWVKDSGVIRIGSAAEWGYRVNYQTEYKDKKIFLDLTHLNESINLASSLMSGEQVGTIYPPMAHLHTGISIDGVWIEPEIDAKMCSR